jgi:type IV pilus assembly protein PilC
MLTSSSIPIDEALELGANCSRNDYFQSKIEELPGKIRRGESLGRSWEQSGMFSDLSLNLLRSGEQSGELSMTLQHVGDYYSREVEASTDALASMVEPALIVIVGLLLGGLLSALYLPMFDIVNVIQ